MFASAPHGSPASNSHGGLEAHQVGRLDRRVRPRDRELHALVRADRPAEDDALRRVARRPLDEPAAVADALGGDQDPLGVHAVEDVAEALALLADQRVARAPRRRRRRPRSWRGSSSSRSGGSSARRRPRACRRGRRRGRRSCCSTSSSGVVRASSSIRSECSRARRPDLLAADDVAAVGARRRVVWMRVVSEPAVGSVTPNACSRSSPRGDLRQVALLLLVAAVPQQRAHRVHLRVAGGRRCRPSALISSRITLAAVSAEPGAAVLLGDQRGEPAAARSAPRRTPSGSGRARARASTRRGKRAHSSRTAARISAKPLRPGVGTRVDDISVPGLDFSAVVPEAQATFSTRGRWANCGRRLQGEDGQRVHAHDRARNRRACPCRRTRRRRRRPEPRRPAERLRDAQRAAALARRPAVPIHRINIYNANNASGCWYPLDGADLDDSLTRSAPGERDPCLVLPVARDDERRPRLERLRPHARGRSGSRRRR